VLVLGTTAATTANAATTVAVATPATFRLIAVLWFRASKVQIVEATASARQLQR
jgi:hypothetical protein